MQVGSLVECTDEFDLEDLPVNEIYPEIGIIYTIRSMVPRGNDAFIGLSEIVTTIYADIMFNVKGFREIQPPIDVSALFEDQLKVSNENRLRK